MLTKERWLMVRASIVVLAPFAVAFASACTSSDPASPENPQGAGSFAVDGGRAVPQDAGRSEADGGIVDSGSESDSALPGDATTQTQDDAWRDGKTISGALVIARGVTVTIDPSAKVTLAAGASIIVQGTLAGTSPAAAHASLEGEAGASWSGLTVQSGGTLAIDGVDLSNAGIVVQAGNASAKFANATLDGVDINAGIAPFTVDKGGTLEASHVDVRNPGDKSLVKGTFKASYLDYDQKNVHALYSSDPSAVVFIEDSTFYSTGTIAPSSGPDVLNAYGAQMFHVAYTDVSGAHCGFHFESGLNTSIEIDHVTVHDVANGADIWGSSTTGGTKTITSSNFVLAAEGLDVQNGSNGTTTVTGCYFDVTSGNPGFPGTDVKIASPASAKIADAKPR